MDYMILLKKSIEVISLKEIKLENKDYDFLKGLSKRLKEQTNDGNADPVFWGIRDYKVIRDDSDGEYIGVLDDGEEIFMEHWDNGIDNLRRQLSCFKDRDELNSMNLDDLVSYIENYLDDENFTIFRYNRVPFISDMTGCFLTKKAAQKHLQENSYHYTKDAHTYAMTAWRNPEFEYTIEILKHLFK